MWAPGCLLITINRISFILAGRHAHPKADSQAMWIFLLPPFGLLSSDANVVCVSASVPVRRGIRIPAYPVSQTGGEA